MSRLSAVLLLSAVLVIADAFGKVDLTQNRRNIETGEEPQVEHVYGLLMRLVCNKDEGQQWNNKLKMCIVVPTAPTDGTPSVPSAPTMFSTVTVGL